MLPTWAQWAQKRRYLTPFRQDTRCFFLLLSKYGANRVQMRRLMRHYIVCSQKSQWKMHKNENIRKKPLKLGMDLSK